MLNISGLKEGIVLDHIEAGKSLDIYYHLGLDKLDCQVAIIKNARSNKMGRKDIIKIEGGLDKLDPDRRKESLKASEKDHQRDPLQEPPLHHFYRAGASPCVLSGR